MSEYETVKTIIADRDNLRDLLSQLREELAIVESARNSYQRIARESVEELAQRDAEVVRLNGVVSRLNGGNAELCSRVRELEHKMDCYKALESQQAASVGGEREAVARKVLRLAEHSLAQMNKGDSEYKEGIAAVREFRAYLVQTNPQASESTSAEVLGKTCIDGGACHHWCDESPDKRCFRRKCCTHFSNYNGPWKYDEAKPQANSQEGES